MSFSRADTVRILDGSAEACAIGEVTWRLINGAWRGEVPVNTLDSSPGSVVLHLNIGRPNQPSFVLAIRQDHCHRLDVNTPHRQLPGTHIQWRDDSVDQEQSRDARGEFPPIPDTGTVGGEQYAATFRAFARYLNIDTSALVWVDPPEGRSP